MSSLDREGLRAIVILGVAHEQNRGTFVSIRELEALRRLRSEVLQAYVEVDIRLRRPQAPALIHYLVCGNSVTAGIRAGVSERTTRQWVKDFFAFAERYLSRAASRQRAETARRQEALSVLEDVAGSQCKLICGREGKGGTSNSSEPGQGCPSCPRRWLPQAE